MTPSVFPLTSHLAAAEGRTWGKVRVVWPRMGAAPGSSGRPGVQGSECLPCSASPHPPHNSERRGGYSGTATRNRQTEDLLQLAHCRVR